MGRRLARLRQTADPQLDLPIGSSEFRTDTADQQVTSSRNLPPFSCKEGQVAASPIVVAFSAATLPNLLTILRKLRDAARDAPPPQGQFPGTTGS